MTNRIKIPGFALLALSLTECTDRSGAPDLDSIVGDWHAVEIDGKMFPFVKIDGSTTTQVGIELHIKADLQGTFLYAIDWDNDGEISGEERGSTVVVDASAAPEHRIEVTHDPFAWDPFDEDFMPGAVVLRCTLDAEVLTCERDADEEPNHLVFERTEDGA